MGYSGRGGGSTTQIHTNVPAHECVCTFTRSSAPYVGNPSFCVTLHPPRLLCYNVILKHIHIDVLHYSINISRVANYERFLFKRLSGFSEQLFNCSTQPYQCKSRRPCKKKKKKVLLTIR